MATYIWQRRGRVTAALVTVFAVVLLFAQMRFSRPALATSGGSAYTAPQAVDTNPDPNIFETTIEAMPATVNIGNAGILGEAAGPDQMANVLTFNGQIPGPEIHLTVGQTVIVHYVNSLGHQSGIHWHGIELNNHSDGTPLTQNQVDPGGTFLYKFKVTRPGIFWYHPHHHSSTNQVFKGLYGAIIVTDPNEAPLIANGTIPGEAQTLTLALSDVTVCNAPGANATEAYPAAKPWSHVSGSTLPAQSGGAPKRLCEAKSPGGVGNAIDEDGHDRASFAVNDVPNIQPDVDAGGTGVPVVEGITVLTNGRKVGGRAGSPASPGVLAGGSETFPVQPGQGLRLRLGNTAAIRFFRLRLTTSTGVQIPLVRIGGQGGLLDNAFVETDPSPAAGNFIPYSPGELLLDPGDRADVVAAIPGDATGVLTLWTEDYQRTGGDVYSKIPTVPVAHFEVTGAAVVPAFTIAAGTPLRASIPGQSVEDLSGLPTVPLIDPNPYGMSGTNDPTIELTKQVNGNHLGINGVEGKHDPDPMGYQYTEHPDSARWALIGSVLELSVTSKPGSAHHPFHLHGFSMWPMTITKPGNATYHFPHEFRDNIDIPPGATLTYRLRLEDRPLIDGVNPGGGLGRWVFHCHIFFHASFGMISELDVISQRDLLLWMRPHIDVIDRVIFGNPGDPVEVRGTYFGVGNIFLNTSLGKIIEVAAGGRAQIAPAAATSATPTLHYFLWTYTPRGGEDQLVYVAATSSAGRDEAAFPIKINSAPVVTASPAAGNEGAPIAIHGTATDRNGDPLVTTWSYLPGFGVDPGATCVFADPKMLDTTITCNDNGNYVLTLTASDGQAAPVRKDVRLAVSNVRPSVRFNSPPSGSTYPVGTPVPVEAAIADPGSHDTLSCSFNWGFLGGPPTSIAAARGTCATTHTFTLPGTYRLSVSGFDDDFGISDPAVSTIVITPVPPAMTLGCVLELDGYQCRAEYIASNHPIDVTAKATWSTSDTAIATVNNAGFVTVLQEGEVAIKARFFGVQAELPPMKVKPGGLRRDFFTLSGFVKDSQDSTMITGATVVIVDGPNANRSTVTSSYGDYQLYDLSVGTFTVRFSKAGYVSLDRIYTLTGDTFNDLSVMLTRSP